MKDRTVVPITTLKVRYDPYRSRYNFTIIDKLGRIGDMDRLEAYDILRRFAPWPMVMAVLDRAELEPNHLVDVELEVIV